MKDEDIIKKNDEVVITARTSRLVTKLITAIVILIILIILSVIKYGY